MTKKILNENANLQQIVHSWTSHSRQREATANHSAALFRRRRCSHRCVVADDVVQFVAIVVVAFVVVFRTKIKLQKYE
jgi:hypothetical protein